MRTGREPYFMTKPRLASESVAFRGPGNYRAAEPASSARNQEVSGLSSRVGSPHRIWASAGSRNSSREPRLPSGAWRDLQRSSRISTLS